MSSTLPEYQLASHPTPNFKRPFALSRRFFDPIGDHLSAPISQAHSYVPLLICCLISGLSDSASYNAWSTFISMQTGNTIFLALGASHQPLTRPYGWLKSLTSILFFSLGCAFFANGMRFLGERKRSTLTVSFLLQTACIVVAASLVQARKVPSPHGAVTPNDGNSNPFFIELVPLGLLAFQSGGQIVASRALGFSEIPTTVLTSVYCDIASDAQALSMKNPKRDRRVMGVWFLLVGGIIGGWISKSNAGMSTVLWIGAGLKVMIAVSWALWRKKEEPPSEGVVVSADKATES